MPIENFQVRCRSKHKPENSGSGMLFATRRFVCFDSSFSLKADRAYFHDVGLLTGLVARFFSFSKSSSLAPRLSAVGHAETRRAVRTSRALNNSLGWRLTGHCGPACLNRIAQVDTRNAHAAKDQYSKQPP
ncbi:hypothetical protein HFO69_12700 [Rhizobium laguerreae]|uniref:hypothetical protein n=1 Tax=Rhizobium laguerreae TaxID=1076926 RepID=UPI001C90122C|nr:hypothetical protein [Rhizobium laguerreae]MBY3098556.1 hypothetical protein [Rhizobium laguerreae]